MEDFEDMYKSLDIPTSNLETIHLQKLLFSVQKSRSNDESCKDWNKVINILWKHLQTGLDVFDDQLLCATSLYSVINLNDTKEFHLSKVLCELTKFDTREKVNMPLTISLMYGLFQSPLLNKISEETTVASCLQQMFSILMKLANTYSKYTFVVFKTISAFKKVIGTPMDKHIYTKANQVQLLNVINHNWESPVSGVRDFNKMIFQSLIEVLDRPEYLKMVDEVNDFYWNKAKFYMLSAIIEKENKPVWISSCIEGLMYSLHKPGLVSAGTDMYVSILNCTRTSDEWCSLFLSNLMETLQSSKVIENFTNYWCLATFKKFPTVMNILLEDCNKIQNMENKIFFQLCLMKQGNKLAILENKMNSNLCNFILNGTEDSNAKTRMAAFDIICISQSRTMPSKIEYDIVVEYIRNNVSSDSTILRLAMLNSLKEFFSRIHVNFLNSKETKPFNDDLKEFCQKLQYLVISCINMNGNYQRKIATIKVCDLMLTCFSEVPKKRKDQTRAHHHSLLDVMKMTGVCPLSMDTFMITLLDLLKDPSDDIREHVALILYNHYFSDICKNDVFNNMATVSLEQMKSKFFYEISCGQTLFRLIIKVLLKQPQTGALFNTVEQVFLFAYQELMTEYENNRNIVESIQEGKQLNSFIIILNTVLEECLKSGYKLCNIGTSTFTQLVQALKGISNQFVWDAEDESSSADFSKMSDMVLSLIAQAGAARRDDSQLSGMQQVVLNCMWLNVKASCDAASLIVKYHGEDSDADIAQACLALITHVLETSRHKGAIESAGAALGESVRALSSRRAEGPAAALPRAALEAELAALAERAPSTTRRGAGLSIMVHRIVASDMRKGKPLFHYFMGELLRACSSPAPPAAAPLPPRACDARDLPRALSVHFLTRVVTDRALAADAARYALALADAAFTNLASEHWQIRNAALQLYGALVSKLIGQKKPSGGAETAATVASDELRAHLPALWRRLAGQLGTSCRAGLLAHSDLIPALNLLASSAKRYCFTSLLKQQEDEDAEMLDSVVALLGSPIYTVRRLAAKCVYNNFPFRIVYEKVVQDVGVKENFLHGSLMLVALYYSEHGGPVRYAKELDEVKAYFDRVFMANKRSYLSLTCYESIFFATAISITQLEKAFSILQTNCSELGVDLWAKNRIRNFVMLCRTEDIVVVLKCILKLDNVDQYLELVQERLLKTELVGDAFQRINDLLLCYERKFHSSKLWEILYGISARKNVSVEIRNIEVITEFIQTNGFCVPYKLRYIIPFVAKRLVTITNADTALNLIKYVFSLTHSDFSMRYIACLAIIGTAHILRELDDEIKKEILKTAVILLQDEDEDIRNICVEFYRELISGASVPHSHICLARILNKEFLTTLFDEPQYVKMFCNEMNDAVKIYCKNDKDEYNPFANEAKNIYIETDVLMTQIQEIINHCI